jgi:capsular polysaccharide biosynthesis protein
MTQAVRIATEASLKSVNVVQQLGTRQRTTLSFSRQRSGAVGKAERKNAFIEVLVLLMRREQMRVAANIVVFKTTKIIVARTWTALSNVLLAINHTVFQIMLRDLISEKNGHSWIAYLTAVSERDWRSYFYYHIVYSKQPEIVKQNCPRYIPFDISITNSMMSIGLYL